jgi:ABC-type lipoprotein release transport system permease subunit
MRFDAAVTFRRPLDQAEFATLLERPGIECREPMIVGAVSIEYSPGEEDPLRLVGLSPAGELRRLNVLEGANFTSSSAAELIVNCNFPGRYGRLQVGDEADVLSGGRRRRLRVVGLVSDPSFNVAYAPLETAQVLLGLEHRYTGASFRATDDASLAAIRDRLVDHDFVDTWQSRDEIRKTMFDYVAAYRDLTRPIISVSLVLAFLFLVTVMGVLLLERDMEYAILRSLGVSRCAVAGGILIEVALLGAAALVLALPIWFALGVLLRYVSAIAYVDPGLTFVPNDFVSIALPACAVVLSAIIPCMIHILRVPVGYALRRKSFG